MKIEKKLQKKKVHTLTLFLENKRKQDATETPALPLCAIILSYWATVTKQDFTWTPQLSWNN